MPRWNGSNNSHDITMQIAPESKIAESKLVNAPDVLRNRFWLKINKGPKDTCWESKFSKRCGGYGRFWAFGRDIPTHRVAWVLTNGEIGDELIVCHKCDNPPCCNPEHLFLGTHKDNAMDKSMKGRSPAGNNHYSRTNPERLARGDRNGMRTRPESVLRGDSHPFRIDPYRCARGENQGASKLTETQVIEILQFSNNNKRCFSLLGRKYGVTHKTIESIVKRKSWLHVSIPSATPEAFAELKSFLS